VLLDRLDASINRIALLDPEGTVSFLSLTESALGLCDALCAPNRDRRGERVAILCRPGRDFTSAILAVWWAGAIAVPLHPEHPEPELDHVVGDSRCSTIITSAAHLELAERLATSHELKLVVRDPLQRSTERRRSPDADDDALIVYTSGTTGRPKGVVHTHASLAAQMSGMAAAWEWTADDRILCILPLHHVHGLVNVTLTPLWVGALCESPGGFDAGNVWNRMASGDLTVFMAVPTVYSRLISAWESADSDTRSRWSAGARRLRLMVSGSAALPVSVLERWRELTGHVLLERYGMTELGMALSNTLDRRTPGHVGWPFPGVEAVIDEEGQLRIRGPQVFDRYWNRPAETASSFVDGWFCTGDIAELDPENGYRLLGRASVDILKTGGEKVSALEIEEVFRTHPAIADCAVVGVEDADWGQRVAIAVIAAEAGGSSDPASAPALTLEELRVWGRERLSAPKVPSRLLLVEDLPRNAMGKVVKTEVVVLFQSADGTGG
jgi:malonyl-CoA/methylmalonyl-CoA synthetase